MRPRRVQKSSEKTLSQHPRLLLEVVIAAAVDELSQQLDGRLRSIRLDLGHVHVVHKNDSCRADGRAERALAALACVERPRRDTRRWAPTRRVDALMIMKTASTQLQVEKMICIGR